MESNGKNKIIAGAIIIAAVALIAIAASMLTKKDNQAALNDSIDSTLQQPASETDSQEPTADSGAEYKDGTYTINDTYPSPGGEEDIKVVLTLKDNKVAAVEVTQEANQRESAEYQGQFQQGYKSRVIGKAIESLELNRVSGSSLTTQAFDEALEQIRAQAKA